MTDPETGLFFVLQQQTEHTHKNAGRAYQGIDDALSGLRLTAPGHPAGQSLLVHHLADKPQWSGRNVPSQSEKGKEEKKIEN